MMWNWQQPDWPHFRWNPDLLFQAERDFLLKGGLFLGANEYLGTQYLDRLKVEALRDEAVDTSAIEGEILNRDSVQSSILKHLGMQTDNRRVEPKEYGIAEMMVDLYKGYAPPLTTEILFRWHRMLMNGVRGLTDIGRYRTASEPMQIVSGSVDSWKVHFEAPPSERVKREMDRFIEWFNRTHPDGSSPLTALTRAGLAHLYFESIHPFEDGNGRIGRALAEKVLSQSLGYPSLIRLSTTIRSQSRRYYDALHMASRTNDVTEWLRCFAGLAIEAQRRTWTTVEFVIQKTKLFDRLDGQLNQRQEKALLRMFQEGPEGFRGGMSAKKYETITTASSSTATRDLADLTAKGALIREGELRHTRYFLNVPLRLVAHVFVDERGGLVEKAIRDSQWDRDREYVHKALAEGQGPADVKRMLIERRWKGDRSPTAIARADELMGEV
jgi:Fic family protein